MAKEALLWCVVVALCLQAAKAADRKPMVHVYTRYPVTIGEENTFQCYVDRFHPPKITITLLKNDKPIKSHQSDLSFHSDWAFHRLVHANVTIDSNTNLACKVEHETLPNPKIVKLETY